MRPKLIRDVLLVAMTPLLLATLTGLTALAMVVIAQGVYRATSGHLGDWDPGSLHTRLQFAGSLLAGIFGIMALLVEYRDKEGRVTHWGKVALVGVLVSTMTTLGSQTFESEAKRRTEATAQRQTMELAAAAKSAAEKASEGVNNSQVILRQVERTLYRFNDIRMSLRVELPADDPILAAFAGRMKKAGEARLRGMSSSHRRSPEEPRIVPTFRQRPGRPLELVGVSAARFRDSPLDPSPEDEVLELFLNDLRPRLRLYKEPVAPTRLSLGIWSDPEDAIPPDLVLSVERGDSLRAEYRILENKLILSTGEFEVDRGDLQSTGRIVSLTDLPGCRMFLTPFGSVDFGDEAKNRAYLQLLTRAKVRLTWNINNIDHYFNKNLETHFDDGVPYYAVTLPTDLEQIR